MRQPKKGLAQEASKAEAHGQGTISVVALVLKEHPYLQAIQEAGREYNQTRKHLIQQNKRVEVLKMTPPHERAWIALCAAISSDASLDKAQVVNLMQYTSEITSEQVKGTVITCLAKKAFPRQGWAWDRYRIELLVVPEIRAVMMEAHRAILAKPRTEERRGAPPRIPRWIEDYSKQG